MGGEAFLDISLFVVYSFENRSFARAPGDANGVIVSHGWEGFLHIELGDVRS
jgi:hypothetical protein